MKLQRSRERFSARPARLRLALAGVKDRQDDRKHSGFDNDVLGLKAELAFGRWANLYPDLDTTLERGKRPDFILPDGRRVDVKGTRSNDPKLRCRQYEVPQHKADIYVLGVVEDDTVTLIGWCGHADIARAPIERLYSEVHSIPHSGLVSLAELLPERFIPFLS